MSNRLQSPDANRVQHIRSAAANVEEFERAQEMINQQIADGTLGDDALDREELAEKFNTSLGYDKFTA